MAVQFTKAQKTSIRLRIALIGPSGSGKTYSALTTASHFGGRIALIDTEHGSASKYADLFAFDTLNLESHAPQQYVEAINAAAEAGYPVLVIDSLSHAWMGKGGALEQVDNAAARSQSKNSFGAWREITPIHNRLVEALLAYPGHLIATLRSKTEYVLEKDDRTGKSVPRKVGMAPIQRDGLEYEFDVVGDMDQDNRLIVSKSRCPALSGAVMHKPGKEFAAALVRWATGAAAEPLQQARQALQAAHVPAEPMAGELSELTDLLQQLMAIEGSEWDDVTERLMTRGLKLPATLMYEQMTPEQIGRAIDMTRRGIAAQLKLKTPATA